MKCRQTTIGETDDMKAQSRYLWRNHYPSPILNRSRRGWSYTRMALCVLTNQLSLSEFDLEAGHREPVWSCSTPSPTTYSVCRSASKAWRRREASGLNPSGVWKVCYPFSRASEKASHAGIVQTTCFTSPSAGRSRSLDAKQIVLERSPLLNLTPV